jgi:tetratricopeptide (TPR) repeat protein
MRIPALTMLLCGTLLLFACAKTGPAVKTPATVHYEQDGTMVMKTNAQGRPTGNEAEIMAYADDWVRRKPRESAWRLNRGKLQAGFGHLEPALADFEEALKLEPPNTKRYLFISGALVAYDYDAEGAVYASRGIAADNASADLYRVRGLARLKTGQVGQGLEDYSHAIALRPGDANLWALRGSALLKYKLQDTGAQTRNHQQALSDFQKVAELRPEDATAQVNLGVAYSTVNQHDKAQAAFERAIAIDPKDANAYLLLGNAYDRVYNRSKACENWKKACELGNRSVCASLQSQGTCK